MGQYAFLSAIESNFEMWQIWEEEKARLNEIIYSFEQTELYDKDEELFSIILSDSSLEMKRKELLVMALEYYHVPYLFGGQTTQSCDCSGFIIDLFRKFGNEIETIGREGRTSANMFNPTGTSRNVGTVVFDVKKDGINNTSPDFLELIESLLQPGDVIFYKLGNSPVPVTHVALYLGEGKIMHAATDRSEESRYSEDWEVMYNRIQHQIREEHLNSYSYEHPKWVYIEDISWQSINIIGAKSYIN